MSPEKDHSIESSTNAYIRWACLLLICFGILGKFYRIDDPWKTRDHYNFGGIWTTTYAECLKTTPLRVSKGIPHVGCWKETPDYYRAHPPTILFAMWGWTSIFGNAEWSYRLFILTFSILNILMIYLIAKAVRPDGVFPWLTAAFQATFLGGLYFGTHLDFIGEFTVFFVLLTAWLALREKMTSACFAALAAGISAWPGYIAFGPLWLYAFLIKKGRKRVFAFGALGFAIALATMMWLHQSVDIRDFLQRKLMDPGYVAKDNKGWLEPFHFIRNYITSHARLLGPLFATFAFYELIRGEGRLLFTDWRSRWANLSIFHKALLLSGGTGSLYALIGHEYVMVHVYLYLLATPAFALLAARFTQGMIETLPHSTKSRGQWSKNELGWLTGIALLFASTYPYGIFKSSVALDVAASATIILSVLTFIGVIWKRPVTQNYFVKIPTALLALGFVGNLLQTMNYRNEPDTQRSFCEKARAEYERTGQPVHTTESNHTAKEFLYCRGVPVVYGSDSSTVPLKH